MPRESQIQIHRTEAAGATPSGLTSGELAVNLKDQKLFVGLSSGGYLTFNSDASSPYSIVSGGNGIVVGTAVAGTANTYTVSLNRDITGNTLNITGNAIFSGYDSGVTFNGRVSIGNGSGAWGLYRNPDQYNLTPNSVLGTMDFTKTIAASIDYANRVGGKVAELVGANAYKDGSLTVLDIDSITGAGLFLAKAYDTDSQGELIGQYLGQVGGVPPLWYKNAPGDTPQTPTNSGNSRALLVENINANFQALGLVNNQISTPFRTLIQYGTWIDNIQSPSGLGGVPAASGQYEPSFDKYVRSGYLLRGGTGTSGGATGTYVWSQWKNLVETTDDLGKYGVATVNGATGDISITGAAGGTGAIVVRRTSPGTHIIDARIATNSLTGVASFASGIFSVTNLGEVNLESNTLRVRGSDNTVYDSVIIQNYTAQDPLTLTITGSAGIYTTVTEGFDSGRDNNPQVTIYHTGVFSSGLSATGITANSVFTNRFTATNASFSGGVTFTGIPVFSSGLSATGITANTVFANSIVGTNASFASGVTFSGTVSGAVKSFNGNDGIVTITGSSNNAAIIVRSAVAGTHLIDARMASLSVTGVASFDTRHFALGASGHVSLTGTYQVTGDTVVAGNSISVSRSNNQATITNAGVTGIGFGNDTGLTGKINLTGSAITVSGNLITFTSGSGGVPSVNGDATAITITGAGNDAAVVVRRTGSGIHAIDARLAGASVTGVASFDSSHFTVTNGKVVASFSGGVTFTGIPVFSSGLSATGITANSVFTNRFAATNASFAGGVTFSGTVSGAVKSFNGNDGIVTITGAGQGNGQAIKVTSTVAGTHLIDARLASYTLTGVAYFDINEFDVGADGYVSIKYPNGPGSCPDCSIHANAGGQQACQDCGCVWTSQCSPGSGCVYTCSPGFSIVSGSGFGVTGVSGSSGPSLYFDPGNLTAYTSNYTNKKTNYVLIYDGDETGLVKAKRASIENFFSENSGLVTSSTTGQLSNATKKTGLINTIELGIVLGNVAAGQEGLVKGASAFAYIETNTVRSFNGLTGAVTAVGSINGCTAAVVITGSASEIEVLNTCPNIVIGLRDNVTISNLNVLSGATFGGNISAKNVVTSVNGATGNLSITGSANQVTVSGLTSFAIGLTNNVQIVSSLTISGGTAWHSLNDGAGSGLDADLVRGVAGQRFVENLQTGLLYGGLISINSGNTGQVNISAGTGIIVSPGASLTAMPNPTISTVNWAGMTGVTLSGLTSSDETWLAIDSSGNLVQTLVAFTDAQYSSQIPLGAALHSSRTNIQLVKGYPHVSYGQPEQFDPFIRAFGNLKLLGHEISANGANLNVNRSAGKAYAMGRNYSNDPNNPNIVTDTSAAPATGIYRFYRNGSGAFTSVINSAIDPTKYDDGTGTLATTTSAKFTIQRIFYLPNEPSLLGVYYGRQEYNSISDAQANIPFEPFSESESTATQAIFCGWLIVQGNCTALNDTADAKFINAGLFRNTSNVGGGGIAIASIDDLNDVTTTTPSNNQVLRWNSSTAQWVNSDVSSLAVSSFNGLTGAVTITGDSGSVIGIQNNRITARIASLSVTGVASFDTRHFALGASGHVSLTGAYQVTGHTVVSGGASQLVSISGNIATIDNRIATASVTGVASFGNQFVVTSGAVGLTSNYVTSFNGATGAVLADAVTWSVITADQTAVVNRGYFTNKSTLLTLTLPTTAAVGSVLRVSGMTAGGWRIAQNASEVIHFGKTDTTVGVSGYLESTLARDSVELICCVTDNEWNVVSSIGNITIA